MKKDTKELAETIAKGSEAEILLKNPLLKEVLESMRKAQHEGIERSKFSDKEGREECYKMLRTITAFEDNLKHMVSNGKAASTILENIGKTVKKIVSF